MADNFTAGSTTFASKDTGGVHTQRIFADVEGFEYETVAASATDQVLGSTGAAGDLLVGLLLVPSTLSPGAVSVKDGAGNSITVFAGGASSLSTLHPFFVSLGIKSGIGGWSVTTGANVSAVAVGDFT